MNPDSARAGQNFIDTVFSDGASQTLGSGGAPFTGTYLPAEALSKFYADGETSLLDAYSDTCLRRVWRVQHFSWWMTSMLHRIGDADDFEHKLQLAELDYVTSSRAAATTLAENYVGLDKV